MTDRFWWRVVETFYTYAFSAIAWLFCVNWWRRRRGYRTLLHEADEED